MIEWLAVMVPIVYSPGPINILAAASGARFGYRKSLPLFLGINFVYFSYAFAAGFGLGLIAQTYPIVLLVMKYLGALIIAYLGVTLIRRGKNRDTKVPLGFWQGAVIHALNPKFPAVLISMYSAFLVIEEPLFPQVLVLSSAILALQVVVQATWCFAGVALGRALTSESSAVIQDRVFGTLLILVGLWVAIR